MLCYQCVETWRGVIGVTGKLKDGRFLWCCYNNAEGEILACYEKKKGHKKRLN